MAALHWLHQAGQGLLDLLYPLRCIECGQPGSVYCPACRRSVPPVPAPICQICGQPLPAPGRCARCIDHPLAIDGIRSAVLFDGSIRKAIHQLKYRYSRDMAVPLGEMLISFWKKTPLPAELLLPVPLSPRRLRERGYNQSRLLAERLGASAGIAVCDNALRRQRHTQSQARLNAEQRRKNVAGAFACVGNTVRDKQILLIDDVCTTGATLEACSIALKQGGAGSVWALTLARAE